VGAAKVGDRTEQEHKSSEGIGPMVEAGSTPNDLGEVLGQGGIELLMDFLALFARPHQPRPRLALIDHIDYLLRRTTMHQLHDDDHHQLRILIQSIERCSLRFAELLRTHLALLFPAVDDDFVCFDLASIARGHVRAKLCLRFHLGFHRLLITYSVPSEPFPFRPTLSNCATGLSTF